MARIITVFNPTHMPVALAYTGESVGAGEWAGGVNADAVLIARGLSTGDLLEVERPETDVDEMNPAAVAAFDATDKAAAKSRQPAEAPPGAPATGGGKRSRAANDPQE